MRRAVSTLVCGLLIGLGVIAPTTALAATAELSGTVTYADGTPIEGATVVATGTGGSSAVTDAAGQYSMTVEEGTFDVAATPPTSTGLPVSTRTAVVVTAPLTGLDFRYDTTPVTPQVRLAGVLRDASGTPIPGIKVGVTQKTAYTAADGSFELITDAGPTTFVISNVIGGGCPYNPGTCNTTLPEFSFHGSTGGFDLTQDRTVDLTLPFHPVTINVLGSDGSPVPSGIVGSDDIGSFELAPGLDISAPIIVGSGVIDQGVAHLVVLPTGHPNTFTFSPYTSGYLPATATLDTDSSSTFDVTLPLQELVTLSGHVLDANGDPFPGISVNGRIADLDGAYSFSINPGMISLNVQNVGLGHPSCRRRTIPCPDYPAFTYSTPSATFDLTQSRTLDITIVDRQVSITAVDEAGQPVPASASSNERGVLDLAPDAQLNGQLVLSASRPDGSATTTLRMFSSGHANTFTVTPDDTRNHGPVTVMLDTDSGTEFQVVVPTLTPTEQVTIAGTVHDGSGTPLAGLRVALGTGSAYTDATGAYSFITDVGTHSLHIHNTSWQMTSCVYHPEMCLQGFNFFEFSSEAPIDVTEARNLDIVIPWRTVHLSVIDDTGAPLPSAYISTNETARFEASPGIHVTGPMIVGPDDSNRSSVTDGNGSFLVLPTGHPNRLQVTPAANSGYRSVTVDLDTDIGANFNVVFQRSSYDGDSVDDPTEAGAPNSGDGNSDGTPDNLQANVTSLPGVEGSYLTIAAPSSTTLLNVQVIDPAAYSPPAGLTFPAGLADFDVDGLAIGADVTLTIFPASMTGVTGYAKYHNGSWTTLPSDRVTILSDRVEIRLTDGGIGDDDGAANGIVSDPGGVVVEHGDTVAPVVTGTITPTPNAAGWNNTAVTIDWTSVDPDPSSGTATDPADTTVSSEGANQIITSGQSCDPADNCATGTAIVSIDTTGPTLTIAAPASVALGDATTIGCSASDDLSGIATDCTDVDLPADTIGAQSYEFTATDLAGNTTTETVIVDVLALQSVTGHVTYSNGDPATDVDVRFVSGTPVVDATDTTDANGDYELSIPDGTYTVSITGTHAGLPYSVPGTIVVDRTTTNDIVVPLPQPVTLQGHVTDPSGDPVDGAAVSLRLPGTATVVAQTTSDNTGFYLLTVSAGTYDLLAAGPPGSGLSRSVPALELSGALTLGLSLGALTVTVTGEVFDVFDRPASGYVNINCPTSSATRLFMTGTPSFELAVLPSNDCHVDLQINANDTSRYASLFVSFDHLDLSTDTTINPNDIVPRTDANITVINPDGTPADVTNITLTNANNAWTTLPNGVAYYINSHQATAYNTNATTLPAVTTTSNIRITLANGLILNHTIDTTSATAALTVILSNPVLFLDGAPGDSNDGDNVDDVTEALAPNNGDGNNDGTPDYEQANVTSYPSTSGNYVTIEAPTDATLANVRTIDVSEYSPPPQLTLPEGLTDFRLAGITTGQDVTLTIYTSSTANVTGYAKYQHGVWSVLPDDRVTIYSDRVEIRLTDGGIGDDDGTANGVVVDPGGIVIQTAPLDTTPPTVTGTITPAPNTNGWNNTPVTIDWTSVDPEPSSGTPTDPTDTTVTSEGANQTVISEPSCDPATNCATGTTTVSIDRTSPTLDITGPSTVELGDRIAISCAATDELSGIATGCLDVDEPSTALGPTSYTFTATDRAGNTTTRIVVVEVIARPDRVPPTVTGSATPAPNANGWNNTPVTIDWTSVDPAPSSGTPTDPADTVVTSEGAGQIITSSQSCDPSNNCGTGTVTVSIDRTAPTLHVTAPATVTVGQTITISCSAADALSGIASNCANVTEPATTAGPKTYTFNATDRAGNSATTTVTVDVIAPANTAPKVKADMDVPGLEEIGFQTGTAIIFGTFSDAEGNGPYRATVRWTSGGQFTQTVLIDHGRFAAAWIYSGTTARTATVRICDRSGACGTDDITIRPNVNKKITPRVCVTDRGNRTNPRYEARWGYTNPAAFPMAVPYVPRLENSFTSSPYDRGQPWVFMPGTVSDAFRTTFHSGSQAWTINRNTATAKSNSTRCTP